MTTSAKIRVTDLDYTSIRAAIVQFLSQQNEFTDHNFAASGLSTIVDTLAYNTHYQGLLANYLANELFMDTAVKRSSIVSRAKELGYIPQSAKAPRAKLTIEVKSLLIPIETWPSSLVIPAGTKFSTSLNNQTFTFVTLDTYSTPLLFESGSGIYRFEDVEIFEGAMVQNTMLYNSATPHMTLPNFGLDVSSLRVWVQNTLDDAMAEYSKVSDFLSLDGESKVFFYQEGFDGLFQISFGDNVIGFRPAQNAIVKAKYLVTSGPLANGATIFGLSSSLGSETVGATFVITTTKTANGGKEPEDVDGIKFNSLNFFGTQNRAVIANDYAALIAGSGINVKSVIVWGGEDNDPPQFGKVFFCVQPIFGDVLTTSDKEDILDLVKSKAVANSRFEFVDPDYIDLATETTVVYDKTQMSMSVFELETLVRETVIEYTRNNLTQFGGVFRYSNLSNLIDSTNDAVLNNTTIVKLKKQVSPNLYLPQQIIFSFFNPLNVAIKDPALVSTSFLLANHPEKMFFVDNGTNGINIIFYDENNVQKIFQKDAGTIDYVTGKVIINPISIVSYEGSFLTFTAIPAVNDILSSKNVIVRLQNKNIFVTSRVDF
jgi:hypothetical protein